jgi:hypothetical protein
LSSELACRHTDKITISNRSTAESINHKKCSLCLLESFVISTNGITVLLLYTRVLHYINPTLCCTWLSLRSKPLTINNLENSAVSRTHSEKVVRGGSFRAHIPTLPSRLPCESRLPSSERLSNHCSLRQSRQTSAHLFRSTLSGVERRRLWIRVPIRITRKSSKIFSTLTDNLHLWLVNLSLLHAAVSLVVSSNRINTRRQLLRRTLASCQYRRVYMTLDWASAYYSHVCIDSGGQLIHVLMRRSILNRRR